MRPPRPASPPAGEGLDPEVGRAAPVPVRSQSPAAHDELDRHYNIEDLLNAATPLTATGQPFAVAPEIQQILCYLDNGVLLVSRSQIFSPHVQGFEARLKRLEQEYERYPVDLKDIAAAYEIGRGRLAMHSPQSDMQVAAKNIFTKAVGERASDIHIRVSKKEKTQILFRVHSDLEFKEEHPYDYGVRLCSTIYQAMSDVSDPIFEPMSRQDARISDPKKIPEGIDGIRIATSPVVDGFIMILRLLFNDSSKEIDLGTLGYAARQERTITILKKLPVGINIIAGPTGSGKSTTLQRTLAGIIRESRGKTHVITVEDPPEYPIPGANQTPVTNASTEEERRQAFQNCIKAAMRCDPDVIMIGEIRDIASATLAIEAAMTGHQVWTTVHANNAFGIIDRLENLGVNLELLTDENIITGLICQRLLKVICPSCSKPIAEMMHKYEPHDIERIMSIGSIEAVRVAGDGCKQCNGTGVIGRTVVAETIATSYRLMRQLRERDKMGALETWRTEQGGMTMKDHALLKVSEGKVDPFQAESVVGFFGNGVSELA